MRRALVSVLLHREVPASRLAELLTEADGDEDSGEDRLAPVHDLDPPTGHGRRAYPARKAAARAGRAEIQLSLATRFEARQFVCAVGRISSPAVRFRTCGPCT